jgi:hypothetical protein
MDGDLGYAKHDPAGRNGGNSQSGHRTKTVLTESGPVDIDARRSGLELRAPDRAEAPSPPHRAG